MLWIFSQMQCFHRYQFNIYYMSSFELSWSGCRWMTHFISSFSDFVWIWIKADTENQDGKDLFSTCKAGLVGDVILFAFHVFFLPRWCAKLAGQGYIWVTQVKQVSWLKFHVSTNNHFSYFLTPMIRNFTYCYFYFETLKSRPVKHLFITQN